MHVHISVAFGMGINCKGVHRVIHFGPVSTKLFSNEYTLIRFEDLSEKMDLTLLQDGFQAMDGARRYM